LFQAWLAFAALPLVVWGAVRVIFKGETKKYHIGQETINLVVGIVAATAALLTLVVKK